MGLAVGLSDHESPSILHHIGLISAPGPILSSLAEFHCLLTGLEIGVGINGSGFTGGEWRSEWWLVRQQLLDGK